MEHFISSDGLKIAYQIWGMPSDLPPVFLHHGFVANSGIDWIQPGTVAALTDAGRQVIALDARGHGASDKPHNPSFYGEGKMAQDLRHLFDLIGSPEVDLAGYSMGAAVSLVTASQDIRVRRLVVGGVGAGMVELGGMDTRALSRENLMHALRVQDPETLTDPSSKGFRIFADRVGGDREALAAQVASRHVARIPFNQIKAATLVIAGDDDPLAVRPEVLAAAIPNARVMVLSGNHGIVQSADFAKPLVEFLSLS